LCMLQGACGGGGGWIDGRQLMVLCMLQGFRCQLGTLGVHQIKAMHVFLTVPHQVNLVQRP
jgi:hypothetical protein